MNVVVFLSSQKISLFNFITLRNNPNYNLKMNHWFRQYCYAVCVLVIIIKKKILKYFFKEIQIYIFFYNSVNEYCRIFVFSINEYCCDFVFWINEYCCAFVFSINIVTQFYLSTEEKNCTSEKYFFCFYIDILIFIIILIIESMMM